MQRFNNTNFGAINSQLSDRGSKAPKAALGALLAFEPMPTEVITLQLVGKQTQWRLVSRSEAGIVVVEASSDADWTWAASKDPAGADVTADWYPIDAVESIAVVDLDVDFDRGDALNLLVHQGWSIRLRGRKSGLTLNTDDPDKHERLYAFVRRLMSDRAAN